jgi:beta-lactam-binding protein with PASTA domain
VNPRTIARRAFPYLIVAVGGFLIAYVVLFVFFFPAQVLPDDGHIPRVVGMTYDAASSALDKLGFHAIKGQVRFHKTIPADVVLEQDPPAGSLQKRGADVTLAVSGGQASATVPEVAGSSEPQAKIAIETAGLTFGTVSEQTSNLARGAVISSTPPAGTTLDLPATVSIIVSQGPSTVQVPDFTGRTLADARSALEQLGLHLGATSRDTSSFMPENTILGQTPAAGMTVSAGASVSVRISRFPAPPRQPSADTAHRDSLPNVPHFPDNTR